jgi:ribosomal protein S12 methylthiotransferase accessory factor YcaO
MEHGLARKDAPPAETIARIHAILESLSFPRDRAMVSRWSAGADCHSCHLRFGNYPLVFANGKGVTPELALASALAEFAERLQCRADVFFTTAGNIHRMPSFAVRTGREVSAILEQAPGVVRDLGDVRPALPKVLPCLPCVDVSAGRVVDLPFDLLTVMTGTSGMCAGNTPAEALAHGICEVFERHVIHEVDTGAVAGLPTLRLDRLPIESPVVRRQLDALRATGVDLIVKDATLGGRFPVLAIVAVDRVARTCHVSFGSDPDFDAALSRCITEAFQGATGLFRPVPVADRAARPLDTYNNLEVLLDQLEPDLGPPRAEAAFTHVRDNRAALGFLLERARALDIRLWVRDCSLFGFPAYHVYAERLSALDPLTREHLDHLYVHYDEVRATLFRLPRATGDEIGRCARVLYGEMTCCSPMLDRQFAAGVLQAPVAACMGLRPLLALMLLETGGCAEARVIGSWRPTSPTAVAPTVSLDSVATWLPVYARTRRAWTDEERLRAAFARAFGREPQAGGTDGLHEVLPVPACVSVYACPSCPCRRYCRLDEWYRLARRLRAGAVEVRQESLIPLLT